MAKNIAELEDTPHVCRWRIIIVYQNDIRCMKLEVMKYARFNW
jgi:hypothetical protein